jgi:hypothetical protein
MDTAPLDASGHRVTSYVYKPLDDATQTIRLIRLQPASRFASDVHCDIYHVSLETNPDYEALSYAWGDAKVTEHIFLQDCLFHATVNLVSALRHLRRADQARTLWVDAICIDQSNVQERGHQVAFMAAIYSQASRDILWLGDDPNDEAKSAFKFVEDMARKMNHLPAEGKARTKALRAAASAIMSETSESALCPVFNDRAVWSRIWIVQELVVARSISIHSGRRSILWDSLIMFFDLIEMADSFAAVSKEGDWPMSELKYSCSPAHDIERIRRYRSGPNSNVSVLELCDRFCGLKATDPRDTIFALLGLATTPSLLDADYTKSASEVFITIIRSTISQTRSLHALCMGHTNMSARDQANNGNIDLPSWVPDFSSTSRRFIFDIDLIRSSRISSYLASSKLDVSVDTSILSTSDISVLVLSGVKLDSITIAFPPVVGFWSWNDIGSFVRELPRNFFKSRNLHHTGESVMVACARTLTGDLSFGNSSSRQSEQEAESLAHDLRLHISWKGRFYSKLRSFLPNRVQSTFLDRLQRRERAQPTFLSILPSYSGYRFSTTAKNFMAMIPDIAEEGDILCVLYGSDVPHVLRKVPGEEETYTMVGTAYVHGFMDGQGEVERAKVQVGLKKLGLES